MLMNVRITFGSMEAKLSAPKTPYVHPTPSRACAFERTSSSISAAERSANWCLPSSDKVLLDPCDHKPMRYARIPAGRYKLWSLGFDGDDDGGKVIASPKDAQQASADARTPGDWVWSYSSWSRSRMPRSERKVCSSHAFTRAMLACALPAQLISLSTFAARTERLVYHGRWLRRPGTRQLTAPPAITPDLRPAGEDRRCQFDRGPTASRRCAIPRVPLPCSPA